MVEEVPTIENKDWIDMREWLNTEPNMGWKRLMRQTRPTTLAFVERMYDRDFRMEVQPLDNKSALACIVKVHLPSSENYDEESIRREETLIGICLLTPYFKELEYKPDEDVIYARGG
jgi:hypothetical protein